MHTAINWATAGFAAVLMASPARAFEPFAPPDPLVQLYPTANGSFLGLGVVEVDAERKKALGLKEERGVEITRVDDDSPAAHAGLKVGDVVLEFNGQRVEGTEQFVRLVRETPVGREVKLSVQRGGGMQSLMVKTGSRKVWASRLGDPVRVQEGMRFELPVIDPQNWPADMPRTLLTWRSSQLGIEAEALNTQLAAYFGVKEGVLVRSVNKGSRAERAGLKAGDVIVKVDDHDVSTPREISSTLYSARSRKSVPVVYIREKKESQAVLPLDPGRAEGGSGSSTPDRVKQHEF